MNTLKNNLEKLLNYYKHLNNILDQRNIAEVEGVLVTKSRKDTFEFYHQVNNGKTITRNYINKENIMLAKNLAQKQYFNKVSTLLSKRIKQIEQLTESFRDIEIDQIYENLSSARKELVEPIVPTLEQKLEEWRKKPYKGKGFKAGEAEIYTNKRERVRSKSEKILADQFSLHGIEYKYECPLVFENGYTIYPDFTIFNTITGEEMYWEHFGMMDNPLYQKSVSHKIDIYSKNGIVLGKQLIATFESSDRIPSHEQISNLINFYFKEER